MLVTIFIATALVSGGVFGFYAAHTFHSHRNNKAHKSALESAPTHLLEAELEKRGTPEKSAYR